MERGVFGRECGHQMEMLHQASSHPTKHEREVLIGNTNPT